MKSLVETSAVEMGKHVKQEYVFQDAIPAALPLQTVLVVPAPASQATRAMDMSAATLLLAKSLTVPLQAASALYQSATMDNANKESLAATALKTVAIVPLTTLRASHVCHLSISI